MVNLKDDLYFAKKAIEQIEVIEKYIDNISYQEFVGDIELLDAIMFRIIQLIENVKNISEQFKSKHPNIPWGKIIGFRNGIVHEYGETNYEIVYQTITSDLSPLKEVLLLVK